MELDANNAFGIKGYTASTYGDSFADVYDQWYSTLNDNDFVEFIVRDLPPTPLRILELGVGTGRLVHQFLSLRGQIEDSIFGVDSSQAMLDIALAQEFPSRVSLVHGDFSEALPDGPFDVVFVGYNTLFNLPDETAVARCMSLVADHLSAQGRFYIDVVRPSGDDTTEHRRIRHTSPEDVVLSVSQHHPVDQRITGKFIQFANSRHVRIRPYSVRYFSPEQLDAMAQSVGLHLASRTEDGNGTLFTHDSPRHITMYAQSPHSPSILKAP